MTVETISHNLARIATLALLLSFYRLSLILRYLDQFWPEVLACVRLGHRNL